MALFRMESRKMDGTYLATLGYRNLQGEFFLNKPKQFRWEMPLANNGLSYNTFFPRKTEMWLYRDDELIFAGPVWNAVASSKDNKISCDAQSIDSYLATRWINYDYKETQTFGQTAWDLISHTQSDTGGDLHVTQGSMVAVGGPSGTVSYTPGQGKYIYDAMDDLSGGDAGFDWEITANRVFNEYYPRLSGDARIRLEYGGNVSGYSVQVMGQYEANVVAVKGPNGIMSPTLVDTAKRTEYGLSHYVGSNTQLMSKTLMVGYVDMLLKQRRDARIVPQVSIRSSLVNPFEGDITYGQVAPLVIDDGWTQFNEPMRLSGFQLTVGKHSEETFVLYLNDLREVEPV